MKIHTPSSDLRFLVKCFWELEKSSETEAATHTVRLVPDCHPEWVFHVGNPVALRYKGEDAPRASRAHIIGQFSAFLDMHFAENSFGFFAIKFHPWAAHLLWQDNMRHYTDIMVDLDHNRLTRNLTLRILDSPDTASRIRIAESFLRKNMVDQDAALLHHCFAQLKNVREDLRIQQLEAVSNLSSRRLEQLFREKIGLSPKRIQRIQRIRQSIDFMAHNRSVNLTEVAHRFHFFDQSHFIREFKHFTGFAPRQFDRYINPDPSQLNFVLP